MAIIPETQYVDKIEAASPEYPYGKARNITVPGDGTGTPLEKAWVNDLFGFQQSLLSSAGIVPSGDADEVGNSQYLEALFKLTQHQVTGYSALQAVDTDKVPTVEVLYLHTDILASGGRFYWDATADKSTANAGTIIDPGESLANQGTGVGTGCWVRQYSGAPNVKWFGAKGDGVTDDATAINSFFNFLKTDNSRTFYMDGDFAIGSKIILDAPNQKECIGNINIISLYASDDYIFEIKNSGFLNFSGKVSVTGSGGITFANRVNKKLIYALNSSRIRFDYLLVQNAKQFGISVESSNLISIGTFISNYIGSTGRTVSTSDDTIPFTSRTDSGSDGSTAQSTLLTLDTTKDISEYSGIFARVIIDGEIYYITAVDDVAKTITVYPWVDLTLSTGNVDFIYGSGFLPVGLDGAQASSIQQWDSTENGIGYLATSLYPPQVSSFVAQGNGIAICISQSSNSSESGSITKAYLEANTCDILQGTTAKCNFEVLGTNGEFTLDKVFRTAPRRLTNLYSTSFTQLNGVSIFYNGVMYPRKKQPSTQSLIGSSGAGVTLSLDLDIYLVDSDISRLFGEEDFFYIYATNESTGGLTSVTFTSTLYNVNGGASAVFNTFVEKLAVFSISKSSSGFTAVQLS